MKRLFIDIPLPFDEDRAVFVSQQILKILAANDQLLLDMDVEQINFRLGDDEDRQKSNYLIKNENGHVSTKKSVLDLDKQAEDAIIE